MEKNIKKISNNKNYNNHNNLINNIGKILEQGRQETFIAVNTILVRTYWQIGKYIVEFEQGGDKKVEYGSKLFERIAKDLKEKYGKGFSRTNIIYMRLLFLKYPKSQTLSDQLSWSHYIELLMIDDDLERSFYEKQCIKEKWSVRELKRQMNSLLFYRIDLSKDKTGVLELSKKGQIIEKAEDIIKDPYVLEFLKIPENYKYK